MSAREEVSVVIPARNEEANIERCVRSIASQQGAPIREIIVVDDQSTDRTAAILEGLRATTQSLQVLRTESLPPGWLGKSYALATGAGRASGAWLLFTDADTEHLPGSLAALLERARRDDVDLLSLSPGQRTPTWWEKAVIPLVYVRLAKLYRFEDVNDPRSAAAAANGQYILVRREAYRRAGGHEAIHDSVLEDVELARRVKSSCGRLLFLPGAAWVTTRMYQNFGAMWEGWTKNLYLLYRKGGHGRWIMREALASNVVPAITVLGFVLAGTFGRGDAAGWLVMLVCAAACLLWHLGYRRALSALDFPRRFALYGLPGGVALDLMLLNSVRVHRGLGKVQWKGREYRAKGAPSE